MPAGYGIATEASGQLDWSWAVERLVSSRNYWVCTASPDGRPHVAPVWGVWLDDGFFFSTDPTSRKGRDVSAGSRVVVHLESGDDVVILEGSIEVVADRTLLERVDAGYAEKYVAPQTGEQATIFVADDHVYRVRPRLVSAWSYATAATRTDWETE